MARVDLGDLPVIDGHAHPLARDPWSIGPETFLDLFTEGRPGTMRSHVPHTGYYRRALEALARQLDVEPALDRVLERRRAVGPAAAARALAVQRIEAVLIDTGYPPGAMPIAEMPSLLGCAIHEVVRVETCAERLLARALGWEAFLDAFRRALTAAAGGAVALKSIVAYRSGLAIRAWPAEDARAAYRRVLARAGAGGPPRLTEKPLLDTLFLATLEVALETSRPLQVHAGFGDPDIDLPQANPLLLRPLLEDERWRGVSIVVLHMAYPYVREAAFMAAVWPGVHLDLSLALPFLGAGAVTPLVEALSLAPASKLLYGSDVQGIPELFALSAEWGRAALGEALDWLVAREQISRADARATARMVLADNARALYRLSPAT